MLGVAPLPLALEGLRPFARDAGADERGRIRADEANILSAVVSV